MSYVRAGMKNNMLCWPDYLESGDYKMSRDEYERGGYSEKR